MNKNNLLKKLTKLENDIKLVKISEHQYTSEEQLNNIGAILNEMAKFLKANNNGTKIKNYSTLSRIVIVQWSYDSFLGKRLIEIENEFNLLMTCPHH